MKNVVNIFGQNAGKIWTALNVYGPLSKDILINKTRIKENDFYKGLGWLARENKISKNGSKYELKETNLTDKIGVDAGKVWNVLNSQGDIDISTITKIAQINKRDAYSALGWLAREDKIKVFKDKKINYGLK